MKKKSYLIPGNKNQKHLINFFKSKKINQVINNMHNDLRPENQMKWSKTLAPDLNDLYRLYQYIYLNKRTTVLEFGTGWSTLIMAKALKDVKKKYYKQYDKFKLRRHNPFELFSLDTSKKYLEISKKRIHMLKKSEVSKINYCLSDAKMSLYREKYVSIYDKFPKCNPDFIYIDGPDPFMVKGNINNFNQAHGDLMPISADLLRIEYYLLPGTIILLDGRTANARFLKDHFKRKWIYKHDRLNDQHLFYLNEKPLGKINERQLKFYRN